MLPLNRETLLMVVAVVCVAVSLYLYKELNKAKAELFLVQQHQNKPVSPAPVNDVNKRKPILVKKSVTVKEPPATEEEAVEAELTE